MLSEERDQGAHGEDGRKKHDEPAGDGQQPRMAVGFDDRGAVRGEQDAAERNRQDEAVHRAGEDRKARGIAEEQQDCGGQDDHAEDAQAVVPFDPRVQGLQKRNGGIRGADRAGEPGRRERDPEQAPAPFPRGEIEGLRGGIVGRGDRGGIVREQGLARIADADHAEEQQQADDAGHGCAEHRGAVEGFGIASARFEQAVRAGKRDVPAAGAAEQGDHRKERGAER